MNAAVTTHDVAVVQSARQKPARFNLSLILFFALIALYGTLVVAGGDGGGVGEEGFTEFYEWLVGLAQGALGKILTILFLIFGIAAGVARGSVAAAVPALGAAALLYFGPMIIDTIFAASLPGLI